MYNFLSSKTERGLRDKMYKHQIQSGRQFQYQILHDGTKWVAWYYGSSKVELKETEPVENLSVSVNTEELKNG